MKNMSPCLNCKNRILGCHSNCEPYNNYRARVNAYSKKRKEVRDFENLLYPPKNHLYGNV